MSSTTFFFLFIPFLAFILLAVNLIFAPHNPYMEKNSAFECGFSSFLGQNRTQFSISFFIFALLFLLFDLEILLVYPYLVSAYTNGIYGLTILLLFLLALTLGFAFELGKKALSIDSRQMSNISTDRSNYVSKISSNKNSALGNKNSVLCNKKRFFSTSEKKVDGFESSVAFTYNIVFHLVHMYSLFKLVKLIFALKTPVSLLCSFVLSKIGNKIENKIEIIISYYFHYTFSYILCFFTCCKDIYNERGFFYLLDILLCCIRCFCIDFLSNVSNVLSVLTFYFICLCGAIFTDFILFYPILLIATAFFSFIFLICVYKSESLREEYPLVYCLAIGLLVIIFFVSVYHLYIYYNVDGSFVIASTRSKTGADNTGSNSNRQDKDPGSNNGPDGPGGPGGPNDSYPHKKPENKRKGKRASPKGPRRPAAKWEDLNEKEREKRTRRTESRNKNKEVRNAKKREARAKNREENNAKEREYRAKNRDRINANQRANHAKDKEKRNSKKRAHHALHRDYILENIRERKYETGVLTRPDNIEYID